MYTATDWEFKLDNTSPFASSDELTELLEQAPEDAPSRAWLSQHIERISEVAA